METKEEEEIRQAIENYAKALLLSQENGNVVPSKDPYEQYVNDLYLKLGHRSGTLAEHLYNGYKVLFNEIKSHYK